MVEQERGDTRFVAGFCWNEPKEEKHSRLAPGGVFMDETKKKSA